MKKHHRLTFRMNDAEQTRLDTISDNLSLRPSAILRQLLNTGRVISPQPIRAAVSELNRIGVNINQLARVANRSGHISTIQLTESLCDLRRAIDELRRCI